MDQHRLICRTAQGCKPGADRIGAGGSTDDGFPTRQTGQHLGHTVNGVMGDHDDQFVGASVQQGLGRPAQHGLSTQVPPLFVAAGARAGTGRDDDARECHGGLDSARGDGAKPSKRRGRA
jgi:hypothetical protein